MKKISARANEMQASPIRKLIPYAVAARKKGINVFPLNIGQPDIPTPAPIREAIRNFDQEVLAYSPSQGEDFLVESFSNYYIQNKIDLAPEDIIVTTGGSEAIFFAFLSILVFFNSEAFFILFLNLSTWPAESTSFFLPV